MIVMISLQEWTCRTRILPILPLKTSRQQDQEEDEKEDENEEDNDAVPENKNNDNDGAEEEEAEAETPVMSAPLKELSLTLSECCHGLDRIPPAQPCFSSPD
jgi:hypothetical protein